MHICYKEYTLNQTYRPDFIAFGGIILELKAIQRLGHNEEAQIINYLKATGLRLGLLLNFGAENKLEWKRFIN